MSAVATEFDAHWMPFTANRDFKKNPRIISGAEGHHYIAADGTRLYDTFSGLWTSGVGHCHPKIVEAVQKQVANAFFTNSGSESVDTALKIALAYHRARGEGNRTRLIGREKGYHGVNFGGMSVGGIVPNRKVFSANLIPGVDHIRHTLNIGENAFSRGQPEWGTHLADDLQRLAELHDGSNIAAVIVEPVAGSAGIIPPPVGYLERLREICDQHGILLIFDEVITAFGRVGKAFGAERFGVTPDLITTAKGLTNGVVPMGSVLVQQHVHDAFMQGPEHMVELFHGYTYSGHPLAAAAGLAVMDVYDEEGTFEQAAALEPTFEDIIHSFKDHEKVIDVRNFGLDEKLVVRNGMDVLQFSPFLNSNVDEMQQSFEAIRRVIDSVG